MIIYCLGFILFFSGGFCYDYGKIDVFVYIDFYLVIYLWEQGYGDEFIWKYEWCSYFVCCYFGDYFGLLGLVWSFFGGYFFQVNVGYSFWLLGVNELVLNGVYYGIFWYEQGDVVFVFECGWQFDVLYIYENGLLLVSLLLFVSWFSNYIFFWFIGEWLILFYVGQIYWYIGVEVLFVGGEVVVGIDFF